MYLLIDMDKMEVRYRNVDSSVLSDLMHIEFPHCQAIVMPDSDASLFNIFSDLDLKLLYLNTCGQKHEGYDKHRLMHDVMLMCQALPETTLNGAEIARQAESISRTDTAHYKYVPGKDKPQLVDEPFAKQALQAPQGFTPAAYTPPPVSAAPAPATAAPAAWTAMPVAKPASTRHEPSIKAPAAGSITDRIFAKAEEMWIAAGKPEDDAALKAFRKTVVEQLVQMGINQNSAGKGTLMWQKNKFN